MDREMTELARKRTKKKYMCSGKGWKKTQTEGPSEYNLIGAAKPINRAWLREKAEIDNPYCKRSSPKCEIDNVSHETAEMYMLIGN